MRADNTRIITTARATMRLTAIGRLRWNSARHQPGTSTLFDAIHAE